MQKYADRHDAGKKLAAEFSRLRDQPNLVVLALPRGGVPVAYEVAKALHAPLDVYIVRKLGVPGHHELAMGAIAQGGVTIFNEEIVSSLNVTEAEIEAVIEHENAELKRRAARYRRQRPFPELKGKIVILIDDGIATGASMKAAVQAVQQQQPKEVIVAVPVADQSMQPEMQALCDEFVCPMLVEQLQAVGIWYRDFTQTEDEEVIALLEE